MTAGLLTGLLVALSGAIFFPGIEYAFLAVSKSKILFNARQQTLTGRLLRLIVHRQVWFITTTRTGYLLSLFFLVLCAGRMLLPFLAIYLPDAINNVYVIALLMVIALSVIVLFFTELM